MYSKINERNGAKSLHSDKADSQKHKIHDQASDWYDQP